MLKSPLKTRPFRNPGQSLDEELSNLLYDGAIPYFVSASALFVLALMEWLGYLTSAPRHPILFTVLAGGAIAFLIVRVAQLRRSAWNLRLGRDGERLVGQSLEELRVIGAQVFHDVPGDGFNLDHIVISDRGIFVVETKTRSKPRAGSKVTFDGDQLLIAGYKPDRDPVQQVRAEMRWFSDLLERLTRRRFEVRGAVLFPEWWVDPAPERVRRDVWVLEPKAFPKFLQREAPKLSAADVQLVTTNLSQYIRSKV